jgi:hypothetical protein
MEHEHYKHTRLEEMDRDPQRWLRLRQIEKACNEAGVTSPWQVFAVAQQMVKEAKDVESDSRD